MFDYLKRLSRRPAPARGYGGESAPVQARADRRMTDSLEQNIATMKSLFCEDSDFVMREFELAAAGGLPAALFFLDGLAGGPSGDIGEERAKSAALAHAGLSAAQLDKYKSELDYEDDWGRWIYQIEFKSGGIEYECEIDARTGEVLYWEIDD